MGVSVLQTLSDKRTAPGTKGSKPREHLRPGQRSAGSGPSPPKSSERPAANRSSKRSFMPPTPAAGGLWLPGQAARKAYPRSISGNHALRGQRPGELARGCLDACTASANTGHDFERLGSRPNPRRGQQVPAADQHTATTELGPRDAPRPRPGTEEGWHRTGEGVCAGSPREHRDRARGGLEEPPARGPESTQGAKDASRRPRARGHRRWCCVSAAAL